MVDFLLEIIDHQVLEHVQCNHRDREHSLVGVDIDVDTSLDETEVGSFVVRVC